MTSSSDFICKTDPNINPKLTLAARIEARSTELMEVTRQRDDLLAALVDVTALSSHLKFTGPEDSPRLFYSAILRARAAIAKVEGR